MYYTAHVQLKHILREKRALILIIIVPQQIVIYLTYFQRWFRIWKKIDHFSHFFKEYVCAETKEIKRKAFATIVTKWTKTFILEKLFVSAKNIWNRVLCIIVIEDLDDN